MRNIFTSARIEFCGKERKFKRCRNKTLITFQKEIEKLQEEMETVFKDSIDVEEEIEFIDEEIDRLNEKIEFIRSAEESTDDEIRKAISFVDEVGRLRKKQRKLEKSLKNSEDENKDKIKKMESKLEKTYADLACLLLEPLTPEEFIDEYDSMDMIKVQNLGVFYNMCQSGFSQSQIDKQIREVVKANLEQTEKFRQKQLERNR